MSGETHRVTFVSVCLIAFLFVGLLQYLPTILQSLIQGDVFIWTLQKEVISEAGSLKYLKDVFLFVFGVYWVKKIALTVPHVYHMIFKIYLVWLALFFCIGCVGYFLDYSPLMFFKAGVRWLLLLHAAIGFFMIAATYKEKQKDQSIVYAFLLFILVVDCLVIAFQIRIAGYSMSVSLGSSRLSGLFSNAGVSGFFSVAAALISLVYLSRSLSEKVFLLGLCLFIALSSGTRFAMIAVFVCFCINFYEYLKVKASKKFLTLTILLVAPIFLSSTVYFYGLMIDIVSRGGILEVQLSEGGRIYNFIHYSGLLLQADFVEFVFGRGLGVGTNTAFSIADGMGFSPEAFRFNWLVDNAILTMFFQVGLLGSMLFWSGVFLFFLVVNKLCQRALYRYFFLVSFLFVISVFSGNLFEQYYLIVTYMFVLGLICNVTFLNVEAKY